MCLRSCREDLIAKVNNLHFHPNFQEIILIWSLRPKPKYWACRLWVRPSPTLHLPASPHRLLLGSHLLLRFLLVLKVLPNLPSCLLALLLVAPLLLLDLGRACRPLAIVVVVDLFSAASMLLTKKRTTRTTRLVVRRRIRIRSCHSASQRASSRRTNKSLKVEYDARCDWYLCRTALRTYFFSTHNKK